MVGVDVQNLRLLPRPTAVCVLGAALIHIQGTAAVCGVTVVLQKFYGVVGIVQDDVVLPFCVSVNGRQVLVHANAEELAKEAEQNLDVFVVADHETIKTAVKNLVENAINYSPEHTTVAVGIGIESGKVAIRVVDQGIGIPAASLSRIFERFYRVDPARSRETGGTGLGLAITKHCVEDCGGTISVWSREGEGSTFTITMPQASGAAEPDHPADSANDNTREKKQSGHSTTTENEENH